MLNLYSDGPGFLILDPKEPGNAVNVGDLEQLVALRQKIGQFLDTGQTDGPADVHPAGRELTQIDTTAARRLASQQGFKLGNAALVYACDAGNIIGARKVGGRYRMPKWAFLEWLEGWKERRATLRVDERSGPNRSKSQVAE